ncbi:hypothetical protein [Mycobacterium gastri]|uniref:Thiol-disulfide oxidoreductase n=1 Tax=Mycobacterium gastri TaxID=1777 RepID=A0A1X1VVU7_MYCGS|nr:hypothetical protein [Mycobacterium gastri]ETW22554.1 hypothetical protein MGAST_19465 [Mycobacterium gastri 'Wayne']ORV73206.1 hypothetical protein AWC07_02865 [Mycobacterium gastri]
MTAVLTDELDLVEYYFNQPWSDGLPVVPPTPERVAAVLHMLGGRPEELVARIPPRWGSLTRELLAVNMVMAGCKPEYAPVVRAAVLALTDARFNLNGIQATTHVVSPLIVVNGPMARRIGMNSGGNVFGSGNRANATIGRAIRLIMLTVGGGIPGELDKSTLGHPGKYTFCIAENEAASPWAPYHVEHGYAPDDSTVLVIGAEAPHSVTNHISDDPQGILDSIASAMSTIAHNNAVLGGSCTVVIGVEHAQTIASFGWTRDDVRRYLWLNGTNDWDDVSYGNRYAPSGARTYNRNLPKWYPRESGRRVPIIFTPDDIHLFVAGGSAGRFSAFLPGWSTATTPVLRAIEDHVVSSAGSGRDLECSDGSCRL